MVMHTGIAALMRVKIVAELLSGRTVNGVIRGEASRTGLITDFTTCWFVIFSVYAGRPR